jgi:glycerol-3-phosphate dehydrogenase (NAD(P)+)
VKWVVVGAGAWGSAFAKLVHERDHDVTLACRDAALAAHIAATGRNERYLPDGDLQGVAATTIAAAPFLDADVIVVAVPSRAFRGVVEALPGTAPVLSLTKGLDPESGERLSRLVHGRSVAVLSGPNFAEEIADGLPAAATIASDDLALAEEIQHAIGSLAFRAYVNDDLVGVELCAAAKNVIALAAGSVDGLELGDNAKAAIITRGLAEMARLGLACGARPETFAGLAGMGDLIVTCWSRHGRNRRAGELIAQGATAAEAIAEIGTVEGITTAPTLRDLGHRLGVELPLTEGVCRVLDGESLFDLAAALMGRRYRRE